MGWWDDWRAESVGRWMNGGILGTWCGYGE